MGSARPPVPCSKAAKSRSSASTVSRRDVLVHRACAEAGMQYLRIVSGDDDVGLEGAEALLHHLAAEVGDVVVRGQLRRPGHLPCPRPRRAAVRPVGRDGVARRAAEELVDRDAQCLPFQVEQRVLDAGDGLGHDRAGALARGAVQIPVDRLHGPRVPPHHERCEVLDHSCQPARRAVRIGDLGPADQAVVSGDLEEDPRTPPGVAEQRLEGGDFHRRSIWPASLRSLKTRRATAEPCSFVGV